MHNFDVLVIGRSCLDFISVVNVFPSENTKVPLNFRLVEGGGQGGNASCCITRLGGSVAYAGKLGMDREGEICLKRLNRFGVDTIDVDLIPDGTTPVAYVFVTEATGERTIIYEKSTLPKFEMDERLKGLVNRSKVVLLDPESTYLAKAFKGIKGPRPIIVYDCERWRDGLEEMMEIADYFIPTAEFLNDPALGIAYLPFHRKMYEFKEKLSGELVVTDGANGAFYIFKGTLYHIEAPAVGVIDTTGAGDNFHAAFALSIAKVRNSHQAVRIATAAASLSCRAYGGRQGVPTWDEALQTAEQLSSEIIAVR